MLGKIIIQINAIWYKMFNKKNYVQFKIKMPLKSNFANNNNVVNEQIQLMKIFL